MNENEQIAQMPDLWVQSSLEDVFENSEKPIDSADILELHMAKNEFESGQLVIRSRYPLSNVTVTIDSLSGTDSSKISTVSVRTVKNVHCRKNTASESEGLYVDPESRRCLAPSSVPAYLVGEQKRGAQGCTDILSDMTTAFWITVFVPPTAVEGTYTGCIRVESDQVTVTRTIKVYVYNVVIPTADSQNAYNNTTWYISCGVLPGVEKNDGTSFGTETQTKDVYGFDNFSEDWWKLLENIADEMKKYRQNCIYVPLFYLLAPDMTIDETGAYNFNWEKFDRFINTFIEHGETKLFEGHHLIHKRGDWDKGYSGWTFKKEDDGGIGLGWAPPSSDEYRDHLTKLLESLSQHLEEKGLLRMFIQHCADEALTKCQLDDAKIVYEIIKKTAPSIKTIDACNKACLPVFGDLLDIYVPRLDEYHLEKDQFDHLKKSGLELWQYTCCGPQENYLSRLEDYKLASTRLLHWYSFKNGISGYLHWAYNLWCFGASKNKPFDELCSFMDLPGDAWIVYPDVEGKSVFQSPRNEAMRDGIEEYELFKMYEALNYDAAYELVDTIVKSAIEHDKTPESIINTKIKLLKGLEKSV